MTPRYVPITLIISLYFINNVLADTPRLTNPIILNKDSGISANLSCIYPNKTIKDTYIKLLKTSYSGRFLRYPLPKAGKTKRYNLKNDGDNAGITYKWESPNRLKIRIYQLSIGETAYILSERGNNVMVQIQTKNTKQNHLQPIKDSCQNYQMLDNK